MTSTLRSADPAPPVVAAPTAPPAERRAVAPVPYDLYVQADRIAALHPTRFAAWGDAVPVARVLQASEAVLALVGDTVVDPRPEAFPTQRAARFVDVLCNGLELLPSLLDGEDPPADLVVRWPSPVTAASAYRHLGDLDDPGIRARLPRMARALAALPFRLGIQSAVERSLVPGDAPGPVAARRRHLDYDALVRSDDLARLRNPAPEGLEDHLFCGVHQITELWLDVTHHLVDRAVAAAEQGRWQVATRDLQRAAATVSQVVDIGQLLDLMVLAEYHPLRVRLRDGSGAQSDAARRLGRTSPRALAPLLADLDRRGSSLLALLDRPEAEVERLGYLRAVDRLAKLGQNFLFQHYLLVLGVLGDHTRGSLGFEVHELVRHASRPPLPEVNQAHHDLTTATNLRYGDLAGSTILRNERRAGHDPYRDVVAPTVTVDDATARRVVGAYFDAIARRDIDRWVGLFDGDIGQVCDVPGTRPFRGRSRIRIFLSSMLTTFSRMTPTVGEIRRVGDLVVVDWSFACVTYHDREVTFTGTETFRFDAAGRLLEAVAHWDPATVAAGIWPELTRPAAGPTTATSTSLPDLRKDLIA